MSRRPRILDLFSGAGGCAAGYHRAGFSVWGVDHAPQPNYPFDFMQADAIRYLERLLAGPRQELDKFDAIHASPPCQGYSRMGRCVKTSAPRLIGRVRDLLLATGLPHAIEGVEGSPMEGYYLTLCGTMFGLRVRRHRLFEIRPATLAMLPDCSCRNGVATGRLVGQRVGGKVATGRTKPPPATESARREAIGVPWMTTREARQAIPPEYTEFVGKILLRAINP
jgi:DNA (cytosine-5)-methyltransferase 1